MTYEMAEAHIRSLRPEGMKWGLERIAATLEKRGNPQNNLKYVHVAGTNGKGSTGRMIQSILTAAGYKTGLFASPAPLSLRETVTVDGAPIPEELFAALTEELKGDELTEFELTTALALLCFSRENVDIAVVECGLGGRDDATNVIPPPLAAVIAAVSLDHTTVLGRDTAEIAAHKCGIIKAPCAVVTTPAQDEAALAVILERAAAQGLTVRIPSTAEAPLVREELGRTTFTYEGRTYEVPLTGAFQRDNALTAIEAVRALEPAGISASGDQIAEGLAEAVLPYRQEVIWRRPLIILDGAHNPHGTAALAATLEKHHIRQMTLITGMLAEKEAVRCMAVLAPFCSDAICCTPPHPRAMNAVALAEKVRIACPGLRVTVADTPEDALAMWSSSAPLLATGSFFVAGRIRELLTDVKSPYRLSGRE